MAANVVGRGVIQICFVSASVVVIFVVMVVVVVGGGGREVLRVND